jgi:hypothetical protein
MGSELQPGCLSARLKCPLSVQTADGRIFVFGHVGGDDPYGKTDQSIIMDSFRLAKE